ncbi:hypothetical protein BsWGS_26716 [Bradybaena similaris]
MLLSLIFNTSSSLVDDLLVELNWIVKKNSSSPDQPSGVDLAAKETHILSLELFQLLALFLSFLVAVTLVNCFAFLGSILQSSGDAVPHRSAGICNIPAARTDSKSKRASGFMSSTIRQTLFPFLGKFHRFGVCRRYHKPTRGSHPESGKRNISSRAIMTTAARSPRRDCSSLQQLGLLGKGEALVDQCKSEIVLRQSSAKSCCLSKVGDGSCSERFCGLKSPIDACGQPSSESKGGIDARVKVHSDWKGSIDERVELYSDRKGHVDVSGEPYSDRKGHVDARVKPYSDRKGQVDARVEPYFDWKKRLDAHLELYSDRKSSIDAHDESYFYRKDHVDASGEPYYDRKDHVDARGEPYYDRKEHVDARGEPYSDRKGHINARAEAYTDLRDGMESRGEPHSNSKVSRGSQATLQYNRKDSRESLVRSHSNWKNGTESLVKPFSNWKNGTESLVKPFSNRKNGKESLADPHSSCSKGLDCWAESNCSIQKDRVPCFQHHERETSEKLIANAPISGFERSRRNTDTNQTSGKLKKKQSSNVESHGNFRGKNMGVMKGSFPNDYCNINSDEAVSDLLQGDLNSIVNKYNKEPWVDNPELKTPKVSMSTKQMASPRCVYTQRRGLPARAAVASTILSKDTISSFTPERDTCRSSTPNSPSYQKKENRIFKKGKDLILKQSPKQKKATKYSNIHIVASKCSPMSLNWEESTVSGKPDIPLSKKIVPPKNASTQTNQVNKQSTGLFHETQQTEFVFCDQQSCFSSQSQLSRCSVASQIERYSIRGSHQSYSSDNFKHGISIFPNFSTEAVINSFPHSEKFLSTSSNHSNIYEEPGVVCNSQETLTEIMSSYCKQSKVYEDKRNTTFGKAVRSGKFIWWPGTHTLSSGDSALVVRAVNGEETHLLHAAPNTVLSSGRIQCLGTSKTQFPASRNTKMPRKRDAGINIKGTCRQSIAVPKDICSVSHKNDTLKETSIKFPLFGKQKDQKTGSLFYGGDCSYPQVSNFEHIRQVLAKNAVVTGSSNYDTDKQSILSQTDATSWSKNTQSRSSEMDALEHAHIIPSINTMKRLKPRLDNNQPLGTHLKVASQEWTEVVVSGGSRVPDYKIESKRPQQDTFKSVRYQDDGMGPKAKQRVDNQHIMLTSGTVNEDRPLTVKDNSSQVGVVTGRDNASQVGGVTGRDNSSQVGVNHHHRAQMDNVLRQEPLSKRSNTTKETRKRRSLIPRHIKTPSKCSRAEPDITENKAPNTVLNGVNTIQTKLYKNPQEKRTFTSAATEQLALEEMSKDKHDEKNLVSETLKSGKESRFEIISGKKPSRFGIACRGKQCISQTQTKTAISPAPSRFSKGGPNRKARSVVKHPQDHFKPNAKSFGNKALSNAMKNPGFAAREPKLYPLSYEHKKSNNAKSTSTTSKNVYSQCKQTDANNELKPPLVGNIESRGLTNVNKCKCKEQNVDTDSNYSNDDNEDDMEKRSDVDDANHALADPFHSNSVSEEISLLTLTTLNYRLMSNSPIPQPINQIDTQNRSSCEMNKDKSGNKFNYSTLKTETPEQITLGPKTGVVRLNACTTLRGKRPGSRRITQSEATPVHKFQSKSALKSFNSASNNAADGSQREQAADFTDVNGRGGRTVRVTTNSVCGNRTPPSDASTTHKFQATYDLKPLKFALRRTDQDWHVEKSTGLIDFNVRNAKTVESAKNIMSRTDSTKTIPWKHGWRSGCHDNSVRRCQTVRSDLTVRTTCRDNSRRLWSELDCNKSNKIHNRTGEPRWSMERLCEVEERDSCYSGTDKQKQTYKAMRYSMDERGLKSRCNQCCEILSTFSPSNKLENSLLDLPSELCTAIEKKNITFVRNAHENQMPACTEIPSIDQLTNERCTSSLLQVHVSATDSESVIPCHQLLVLPSCTPQSHKSGLCQPQINDEHQEREERRQFVREGNKETSANRQIGNANTTCSSIQRRFNVGDNDTFADPVTKSGVGRKFKFNTRFYRNDRTLSKNISQGKCTRVKNLHRNGVSKLSKEQPKQNQTCDRDKRLRNRLRIPPKIKTAPKEIGNCEARIQHSLEKTANIEQIKPENKYSYTVMKTNCVKHLTSKKLWKPMCKAMCAEKETPMCTGRAEDDISHDNGTLICDSGVPYKTTSQRLKVGKPGLSQSLLNVFKCGLENDLADTQPHTIQIQENTDKLADMAYRELESLTCTSRDNVVLNQDGTGNMGNSQQATASLIVNNVSKLGSAARSVTQCKHLTGFNTTVCHGDHIPRNEEVEDHERTLSLSNYTPHRSNNFSICRKKRSFSGSSRSSRSMASEAVGTATCVCSPDESVCSVLEINKLMGKPKSRAEVGCADTNGCRRTALVRGAGGEILGSQLADKSRADREAHCFNTREERYQNKQRHAEFSNATVDSEISEKSVFTSQECLNIEKVKFQPSRTELLALPEYVAYVAQDYLHGALACTDRFSDNEKDNEKDWFHKTGPHYTLKVNDECCSKTRSPGVNYCVPDLIMCPWSCSVGCPFTTNCSHQEQGRGLLQSSQARANTRLPETDARFDAMVAKQTTNSESKLFSSNTSLDCTSTDSEDSSDFLSTWAENGPNMCLEPTKTDSVNNWPKDSESTYESSLSQESELRSCDIFSNSDNYNDVHRCSRKSAAKNHNAKENKPNSNRICAYNAFNSHKREHCLIKSPPLKVRRSQSSPDGRKLEILSTTNKKKMCLDKGRQPEKQSTSVSMCVDRKGTRNTTLVQGDIGRTSAFGFLLGKTEQASPRFQGGCSNKVSCVPVNLSQQLSEVESGFQRHRISLLERRTATDGKRECSHQDSFKSVPLNMPFNSIMQNRIKRIINKRATQAERGQHQQSKGGAEIKKLTSKSLQLLFRNSNSWLWYDNPAENGNSDLESNTKEINIPSPSRLPRQGISVKQGSEWARKTPKQRTKQL